jgi:nitrilase
MPPVKVAAVQAATVLLDRDETIGKVVKLAGKAAAEGARLVAFPEAFVPGYPDWAWRTRPWDGDASALYACLLDQSVVVGSAATDVLAETARRLGIWLQVGVDERDVSGFTIYNSPLHFAPDRSLAARHRKLMPTGGERLVWGMGAGSTLKVIDTGFGRLGGLICWANYMPLARVHLYAQGIDVWIAPTLAVGDDWIATMRHLAHENRMFVVGVNRVLHADQVPAAFPAGTACWRRLTSNGTVPGWRKATPSPWHGTTWIPSATTTGRTSSVSTWIPRSAPRSSRPRLSPISRTETQDEDPISA